MVGRRKREVAGGTAKRKERHRGRMVAGPSGVVLVKGVSRSVERDVAITHRGEAAE